MKGKKSFKISGEGNFVNLYLFAFFFWARLKCLVLVRSGSLVQVHS